MLIRYPGSKDRQAPDLLKRYPSSADAICIPFGGTMAVAFALLKRGGVKRLWYNDIDAALRSLWRTVKKQPEELKALIRAYTPNADDFYTFRDNPGSDHLTRAFRKIVLHQISYSGLGAKAGSPIGGRKQKAPVYLVGCRWNAEHLCEKIDKCVAWLRGVKSDFTVGSWETVLSHPKSAEYWLSVDPPYYLVGAALYLNGLDDPMQHKALAKALLKRDRWVLSYDECLEVRELYKTATIETVRVISSLKGKAKDAKRMITDLVITP